MKPKKKVNLSKVNLRSHPGLAEEDIVELQQLGYGSVQSLIDAADTQEGNFTNLSTAAIVLDDTQSERIGTWLLGHPYVPSNWKQKWEGVQVEASAPAQAPSGSEDAEPAAKSSKERPSVEFVWW